MPAESQKAWKYAEIWNRQSACPERRGQARVGTASSEHSEDGEVYSTAACSGSSAKCWRSRRLWMARLSRLLAPGCLPGSRRFKASRP
jgi:hypothetical protein